MTLKNETCTLCQFGGDCECLGHMPAGTVPRRLTLCMSSELPVGVAEKRADDHAQLKCPRVVGRQVATCLHSDFDAQDKTDELRVVRGAHEAHVEETVHLHPSAFARRSHWWSAEL